MAGFYGFSSTEELKLTKEMNQRFVGSPETDHKWEKVCGEIYI